MFAAFLSARLRAFLLFTVALPLGAFLLRALARTVERRRGPNGFSQALHRAAAMAHRRR